MLGSHSGKHDSQYPMRAVVFRKFLEPPRISLDVSVETLYQGWETCRTHRVYGGLCSKEVLRSMLLSGYS